MGKGRSWTEEEISVVRDNPDLAPEVLAEKLGRSAVAVKQVRWKLNPGGRKRGKGSLWENHEVDLVRENLDEDANVLAELLGRSRHSVNQMKAKLRRTTVAEDAEYDLRPSGWYDETIGLLLVRFPDVMATWRHYHRYVIVKYVSTQRTGWVTLKCYRDATSTLTEEEFLELPYSGRPS